MRQDLGPAVPVGSLGQAHLRQEKRAKSYLFQVCSWVVITRAVMGAGRLVPCREVEGKVPD